MAPGFRHNYGPLTSPSVTGDSESQVIYKHKFYPNKSFGSEPLAIQPKWVDLFSFFMEWSLLRQPPKHLGSETAEAPPPTASCPGSSTQHPNNHLCDRIHCSSLPLVSAHTIPPAWPLSSWSLFPVCLSLGISPSLCPLPTMPPKAHPPGQSVCWRDRRNALCRGLRPRRQSPTGGLAPDPWPVLPPCSGMPIPGTLTCSLAFRSLCPSHLPKPQRLPEILEGWCSPGPLAPRGWGCLYRFLPLVAEGRVWFSCCLLPSPVGQRSGSGPARMGGPRSCIRTA